MTVIENIGIEFKELDRGPRVLGSSWMRIRHPFYTMLKQEALFPGKKWRVLSG
jgi:hypothetical protein